MNKLIVFELRQNKRGFWTAFLLVGLLQAIPAAAKSYIDSQKNKLQGVRLDSHEESLLTFERWVSGQPFTFFLLLLGFFSMSWAVCSIVKERDRQTGEFLFTLPHSRTSIYLTKWLANCLQVLVIAVTTTGIVLLIGEASDILNDPWIVTGIMLAGLLTSLAFMGIGFALTPWLNSERGALSIGIGIVSLMFLFSILSSLNDNFNWLANISLFNLFDAFAVSQGDGLAVHAIVGALVLFIGGSFAGWGEIVRRDL